MRFSGLALAAVSVAACEPSLPGRDVTPEGDADALPSWHFARAEHPAGDVTLTSVYARSDDVLFVAGWGGVILTNEGPRGLWRVMPTPTTENLTAIAGVENGGAFGLPGPRGEMLAVGWHGTILHYHPNPDGDATTEDGAWTQISGPGGDTLSPRLQVDPACPDYDGDGISDDGDGDGFAGNAICAAGDSATCDDNCRGTPNGTARPYVDVNLDACIGPGDGPDPDASALQRDEDADGVGAVCDDDDADAAIGAEAFRFEETLFDVVMTPGAGVLYAAAVGDAGAVVYYRGVSAAQTVTPPTLPITDAGAWTALRAVAYRYEDDCAGTPAGSTCGNGRLPPACPAQCSPVRSVCNCPSDMAQCCSDGAALTGAGCGDGSCGPAVNACDAATGRCSALCPDCFRRQAETLRAAAIAGTTLVAVGARGTILEGDLQAPELVWTAPGCPNPPAPLDGRPLLTGLSASGVFHTVGSGGALLRFAPTGCNVEPVLGGPGVFLSAVAATSATRGFAAGDRGVLVLYEGAGLQILDTGIVENLLDVTVTNGADGERVWVVGAGGVIVRGGYY